MTTKTESKKFAGCFTAIVTPYHGSGMMPLIDYAAFKRLIELQDKAKVAGIVPCGTTGESPTLTPREHNQVIDTAIDHAKCLVIAGTGSNSTLEAVRMTKHAADSGAAASLQVCPYYNKPNQEGLFRHFATVAESADIPHILYNIPGRSGKEIAPETMARLAQECSNIIGVKEASGKEEVWKKIREVCPKNFIILSGNDGDTVAMMKNYGTAGVISVASNIIPAEMQRFVSLGAANKWAEMERMASALKNFFDVLFIDTNPIMVKEAMNMLAIPAGGLRLPMCETTTENRKKLREVLATCEFTKERFMNTMLK